MSVGKMRVLAVLFFIQGFFYVAFTVRTTVINRLEAAYNTPGALVLFAYGFFLVMLGVGAFFIARGWFLFTGSRLLPSDLPVSAFSFLLWFFPAWISFADANTYFTTAPESLWSYAYNYLMMGYLFSIIGAVNILSMVYMGWLRFNKRI